jgi:hypothetical protein
LRRSLAHLHDVVVRDSARPFHFLDIACGDASAGALTGTAIAAYTGIDFSEFALELAARNLARFTAQLRLSSATSWMRLTRGMIPLTLSGLVSRSTTFSR